MGTSVALTVRTRLTAGLVALAFLAACGTEKPAPNPIAVTLGAAATSTFAKMKAGKSGATGAAKAPITRADIEKAGVPVLRAGIPSRGTDGFMTVLDRKGDVVTWKTPEGTTFALRSGVLTQTRGLGPDLMSSNVPSVGQLLQSGGTYQRQYFFLGPDDQPTRRTYECTATKVGTEVIEIFGKSHSVTRVTEDCVRPLGTRVQNEFWIEGQTVRKSKQWASALIGHIEMERVVD
jgi:hypothetical protein